MSAIERTPIVVFLTEPDAAESAISCAVDYAAGRHVMFQVIVTGSDTPGAPRYVSPADRSVVEAALKRADIPCHCVDGGECPAQKVLATANEVDAAIIVLGTRGRTATGKLVMGSFARQVPSSAECPVVTVRH